MCWTWSYKVKFKPSQKKWIVDHHSKFNGFAYYSQVCHMPHTKRKIGVSENGRPTRQNMRGTSSIHLLRSLYV